MGNPTDCPVRPVSKSKEKAKKRIESNAAETKEIIDKSILLNFDAVVKAMSESVLTRYLHDILSFLLSDRSEVRFEASGYAELFLVNLFRSVDNLHCKSYNKLCASMCTQIIKVLERKKDVYKCITFCERNGDKKVLVYQKENMTKKLTTCCDESCCASANPQSITEGLHSTCPDYQKHKVSDAFKTRWLNTTMKFIKDESKFTHKYPEMSPIEATFVYSTITRCKDQTDIPPNSFYIPLKELMQIYSLKYFFELTYIDAYCNGTMCLMLEKYPKSVKTIIEGDKRSSNKIRNMKYIKQLKTRTSDENRAGVVISRLKNQERFKADTNRLGDMAPPEVDGRVADDPNINASENASCTQNEDKPEVPVFEVKRNRKNKGRGNVFVPAATDRAVGAGATAGAASTRKSRLDRCLDERTDKLIRDMSVPIKSDKAMRMMYGMGWDGGALGARGEGITEPIIPPLDLKAGVGFGHNARDGAPKIGQKRAPKIRPQHPRSVKSKPKPEPCVESKILLQPSEQESKISHQTSVQENIKPNQTPMQITAPQSTSVESVKLKIQPNTKRAVSRLHRMQGNIQRLEFRLELYKLIRDFLSSEDTSMEVERDSVYTIKEKRFIVHALRAANERNKLGGSADEERLWNEVLFEMHANEALNLQSDLPRSSRRLKFIKSPTPYISKKKKRNMNKKVSIVNIPALPSGDVKVISNDFMRELTDTYVTPYAGPTISKKAETGVTYRVVILISLLDALNSDRIETQIDFENDLNDKEKDYLENTCATVGVRKKRGGSRLEQELLCELKDNLDGLLLRVKFLSERSFIIYKIDANSVEKSSRDVSCATYSTDNNGVIISSRGSDDSDAGQDDLHNDDNDGDDEQNDSNDASDSSKPSDTDRRSKQEHLFAALVKTAERKQAHDMILDKNENNCNELDINVPWSTICDSEMDVQGVVEEPRDVSNINSVVLEQAEDSDKLNGIFKDSKNHADIVLESKNGDLVHDIELNMKTSATASPDIGTNTEIDFSTNEGKSSIFDVIKSFVEDYTQKEIYSSETNNKHTEIEEVSNCLKTNIENLEYSNEPSTTVSTDNNTTEPKEVNIKISNSKNEEELKTNIPQTTITVEDREPRDVNVRNYYVKRVYIVPGKYPMEEVDTEFAKNVQILISKHIEMSMELPLLKCHGVQDGALIYGCHSENTLKWLENVCVTNNIRIIIPVNDEVRYKMSLKIISYIEYTSTKLFHMLQLYNDCLKTDSWVEIQVEKNGDSLTFLVEIDEKSMKYIKESNFTLFAGIDQVQFKPVWY